MANTLAAMIADLIPEFADISARFPERTMELIEVFLLVNKTIQTRTKQQLVCQKNEKLMSLVMNNIRKNKRPGDFAHCTERNF